MLQTKHTKSERSFLIIDDDLDDQELLIEALHEIDETIMCFKAGNGEEGMNMLTLKTIPFPQVIFVDMNMPKINGRKFLTLIKKEPLLKNITVIIYSTSNENAECKEMLDMGAAYFLKKPSNYEILKERLRSMELLSHLSQA